MMPKMSTPYTLENQMTTEPFKTHRLHLYTKDKPIIPTQKTPGAGNPTPGERLQSGESV